MTEGGQGQAGSASHLAPALLRFLPVISLPSDRRPMTTEGHRPLHSVVHPFLVSPHVLGLLSNNSLHYNNLSDKGSGLETRHCLPVCNLSSAVAYHRFILGQRYPVQLYFDMETEETKDYLKNVDWKTLGNNVTNDTGPVAKKRLPKKLRQVPDYYFLPRRSLSSALALSALVCAAGVGAGMLVEVWINKKIQEDGGVIWELDKK
ncbi:hypothetical protein Taro_046118 [Colocasia esculenta]|uniref:Uncharacterized protein n=1 Tax=Colocasia esculenta TaxID=4460 RepID=A0A843X1L8_COLES|nr:hypothetical protein [Colocasia esculenta]